MQASEVSRTSRGLIYDALFATKPYMEECRALLNAYGKGWRSGLDIGCGTGAHTICLSELGLEMTGVESDPEMHHRAVSKIAMSKSHSQPTFLLASYPEVKTKPVDFVVALFNVVNYILTEDHLKRFLRAVRESLVQGEFVFDVWNASAIRQDPPKSESRLFELDGRSASVKIEPVLSHDSNFCLMRRTTMLEGVGHVEPMFVEHLWHRVWTQQELGAHLRDAHFDSVRFTTWAELGLHERGRRSLVSVAS